MIKVECDKCGQSTSRCNFEIQVLPLINTTPQYFDEAGDAKLTCEADKRIRFVLCEDCYRNMGLPNVYYAHEKGALVFRRAKEVQE